MRRSNASRAGLDHGQRCRRVANAAAGFDAELWANGLAEQFHIFDRGAAWSEAGGSLNEAPASFDDHLAGANLFLAIEKRRFDDDFDGALVSGFDDVAQFAQEL